MPLRAGSFYEVEWTGNRGIAIYDGTGLGAFTISDTSWSFQNVVVGGNFTWTVALPLGVLDPATATSQVWTNGTGPNALSARLYIPQPDGFGGFTVQPYDLDSTNLQPGGATFTVTPVSNGVKYTATLSFTGRFSSNASLSVSGAVTAGNPDSSTASMALRDGLLIISNKAGGNAYVVPEPSTGLATGSAGALLVLAGIVARRRNAC